jgi:hypothetical protein
VFLVNSGIIKTLDANKIRDAAADPNQLPLTISATQYVMVSFPEHRRAFIDGMPVGETNEVLMVEAGTHEFSLGLPANYDPPSIVSKVSCSTALTPLSIMFSKK